MFIKDSICISPQATFPSSFRENVLTGHTGNKYFAIEPSYDGLIQPGVLRRMGKAVRMGVAAGTAMLRRVDGTDGIIIGTANGGLEDCIKFLNQIVDFEEGTLTPTNFVQSTPTAIAGQLAMAHRNTGYNITHAHDGLSFENALTDASLLLEQNEARLLLVGSVEEISDYHYNIDRLSGVFKEEMTSSSSLLTSASPGTVSGEGATMFLLEHEASSGSQVEILGVYSDSSASPQAATDHFREIIQTVFPGPAEAGALILGYNGDARSAEWYRLFREGFSPDIPVFSFKNACGEYPTASSFALWLGQQILLQKPVPAELLFEGKISREIENIIIFNHYREDQNSLILLRISRQRY